MSAVAVNRQKGSKTSGYRDVRANAPRSRFQTFGYEYDRANAPKISQQLAVGLLVQYLWHIT